MQPIYENFADSGAAFIKQSCLSFLRNTQNPDGGWGFTAASQSRVEATAWALLALREFPSAAEAERIERAVRFLHSVQLPDGSWPSAPGQQQGSWVTALACWSLKLAPESRQAVSQGLDWLSHERPADSRQWQRFLRRLAARKDIVAQNDAYFGWSWTPGTASWVEPTSYAMLVLRHGAPNVQRRLRRAELMLFDRMCPGGGWNCGNPMVYGVPGEAQIGPTVWALLALRETPVRGEIKKSLDWLERNWQAVSSPGSLALAQIGLSSYDRSASMIRTALYNAYSGGDELLWSIPAVAWSVLATSGTQGWLKLTTQPENA